MIERTRQVIHNLEHDFNARVAMFAGVATLAISGMAASKVEADTANAGHVGEQLEQVSQLPGYHIGLTNKAKIQLKDSAVVVQNNTLDEYNIATPLNLCSGNVVSYKFHEYVSLDAHCEEPYTGNTGGIIYKNSFPNVRSGALDFIKNSSFQTVVEETNTIAGLEAPIANATGIDVSTEGVDSALIRVSPLPTVENKKGVRNESFGQHAHHPYMDSPTFVPGQRVALYSSPVSNARPVSETGRFIGMDSQYYLDNNGKLREASDYAVVTYPKTPQQDAGYWGASGSQFAGLESRNDSTQNLHGKVIYSTGGLSRRISTLDVGNPYAYGITKGEESVWIEQVENQTGVKINKGAVLLLYSDPSLAARKALVNNFNNYIVK